MAKYGYYLRRLVKPIVHIYMATILTQFSLNILNFLSFLVWKEKSSA